jgi:hypothetical protein
MRFQRDLTNVKIDKRKMNAIRYVTGTAAVLFIGLYLYATWGQIRFAPSSFHWKMLAFSWILLASGFCINGLVWKILLSANEKKAGYFDSVYMVSISMLMRYIPGKIWQLAGRYSMASGKGFGRDTIVTALVEEATADICGGIIIAYAAFGRQMGWYGLLFLCATAVVAAMLSLKSIRDRFHFPAVRIGRIGCATVLFTINWIVYGAAFYCTIRSLYALDLSHVLLCAGSMAAGWVGGTLSFIIPNGLGVREGIAAVLLSPVLAVPQAMAAALFFRISSTVVELCLGGALYCVNAARFRTR